MGDSLHTLIRDLHRRRGRERRGLALAAGGRLLEEAVAAGVPLEAAAVSPALEATPRGRALKVALVERGVRLTETSDHELADLAATDHPQGAVAVIRLEPRTLDAIEIGPRSVVLVLDAVQDPGNVGTIVRTAFALGAAGVVTLPGTAELTNPKTLRATMGAAFRLPVVASDDDSLTTWLAGAGVTLIATGAGGEPFDPAALPRPLAMVLGNEGAGVRPALAGPRPTVSIPLAAGADSLNVAVTAGILLYGVTRE